jgi:hypothetical protein
MICGIDYSINSPALSVSNLIENDIIFFGCIKSVSKLILPQWTDIKIGVYDIKMSFNKKVFLTKTNNIHLINEFDGVLKKTLKYRNIAKWSIEMLCFSQLHFKSIIKTINIEDYAYGKSYQCIDLAENLSILKLYLVDTFINFEINFISPTSIKKFACNKGKASKLEMISSLKISNNFNVYMPNKPLHDIADSYFIMKYKI